MDKLRHWLPTRKSYRKFLTDVKYARYRSKHNESANCSLCDYDKPEHKSELVKQTNNWLVIKNKFPYERWDWRHVHEHLMIVPKRHIIKQSDVKANEWIEFSKLVSNYDQHGFSAYLRSQQNSLKTVQHFHWHLIKIN